MGSLIFTLGLSALTVDEQDIQIEGDSPQNTGNDSTDKKNQPWEERASIDFADPVELGRTSINVLEG